MRIGLVRHFKVNQPFPRKRWLSKQEVIQWFEEYDHSTNIEYKKVDLNNINWKRCYSSNMLRAVNTASHIFKGEIVEVPELRELDILHRLSDRIKLPFIVWGIVVRVKSMRSNQDMDKFKNDIIAFVDKIISNKEADVLIVSHWFVMQVIRKELVKRGLSGSNFKHHEYGTLYVYEKRDHIEQQTS